jgi:hypothetical protein
LQWPPSRSNRIDGQDLSATHRPNTAITKSIVRLFRLLADDRSIAAPNCPYPRCYGAANKLTHARLLLALQFQAVALVDGRTTVTMSLFEAIEPQ